MEEAAARKSGFLEAKEGDTSRRPGLQARKVKMDQVREIALGLPMRRSLAPCVKVKGESGGITAVELMQRCSPGPAGRAIPYLPMASSCSPCRSALWAAGPQLYLGAGWKCGGG